MAVMVLTAQYLALNGVDRSSWTRKAEVAVEVDEKDVTTYASLGWRERIGGLKSGSVAIEFLQDVAASQLDATMWALLGTVVTFEARATNAAVGTSNPKYTGSLLISGWNPLTGSVGDEATVSVTYPTSGAVTRATS